MVATDLIDTLHKVFPHAKIRLLNSKEQTTMESLVHLILVLVQARKVQGSHLWLLHLLPLPTVCNQGESGPEFIIRFTQLLLAVH